MRPWRRHAHVTAPLRRLVDRFGLELCYAVLNARAVPEWVRAGLALLPEQMAGAITSPARSTAPASTRSRRRSLGPGGADLRRRGRRGGPEGLLVQVTDPAILAQADGSARIGAVARAAGLSGRRGRDGPASG